MIVTAVLTCYCIVYLYIALRIQLVWVSVITGLVQNTIISVTLAGSGGVIRWWPCNEPNVDILFTFLFYFIEKENTETGDEVWW